MRIQQIILLFMISLFWLAGCYKDKGNYDYIFTNELTISLNPINRKGFVGEPYIYYPTIKFLDETDTTGFEYWWEYTGGNSTGGYDTLCMGRELNFIPNKIGYMDIRMCAKELSTGVITSASLQIQVETSCAKGWVLLTEKEGTSALSFIRPGYKEGSKIRAYTPYLNIYQQLYPKDELGQHPYRLKQLMNSEDCILLLIQDNNPIYLNGNTYEKIMTMDKEFVGESYPKGLVIKDVFYGTSHDMVLDESGTVYSRDYMGQGERMPFFSCAFVNIPVQLDGKVINVDRFINTLPNSSYFFGLYDKENGRVLWGVTSGTYRGGILPSKMTVQEGKSYIDLDDIGNYELLHGSAYGALSGPVSLVLLFKDQDGNMKIQTQKASLGRIYPGTVSIENVGLVDFSGKDYVNDATKYYGLQTRPYVFFATSNVLYWYDVVSGVTHDFYHFPAGSEVVGMESNSQESELGVLLKNGSFVILNIVNEKLYASEKMYEQSGLGIGVNLLYKYPNYRNYLFRTIYKD